jgi:hypothetical protein
MRETLWKIKRTKEESSEDREGSGGHKYIAKVAAQYSWTHELHK